MPMLNSETSVSDTPGSESLTNTQIGTSIHPSALVESDDIGTGTRIWAFAHILSGARIGRRCNVGEQCYVEGGARIGDDVTLKNGCAVWDGVTIGDGVFVGPRVAFTNDRHPRSRAVAPERYADSDWLTPTVVRRGATLGAASVLVAGVTVGEFAFIAAGAVVVDDVPDYALVVGVPCRLAGWVCRCGGRLNVKAGKATCGLCTASYSFANGRVAPAL